MRRSELEPEPRSQRAIRINDEGIVLVRDERDELRAFHNTCRHRGHELLADGECRVRGTIACPYHSWAYNLDGTRREGAETMSLDGTSLGMRLPALTDDQARQVFYYALFPNLLISPHPDYVMTHRLHPVDASSTWVECAWLFAPESAERPGFDPSYAQEFWDVTNRQDFSACEAVQRGLGSRGFIPGPFDYREYDVYAFQAMLAHAYLSGEVPQPRAWDPIAM